MNCGLLMRRQWSLLKGFLEPRTSWKSSISGLVSEPYIALWACLPDSYCTLLYTLTYVHAMFSVSHTHTQPFYGPFPGPSRWAGARRELLDFMVQGKINRDRHTHTNHPVGRHSIRTNQCSPPPSSPYFLQAGCPSCHPTNSVKALKAASAFGLGRRR